MVLTGGNWWSLAVIDGQWWKLAVIEVFLIAKVSSVS